MTLDDLIPAHFDTKAALAKELRITRQAINNWPNDIPELYELRLKYEILPGRCEATDNAA